MIDQRIRNDAIELLLCAADAECAIGHFMGEPRVSHAHELAFDAWCHVRFSEPYESLGDDAYPWCYLEAAARLHEGWTPTDRFEGVL